MSSRRTFLSTSLKAAGGFALAPAFDSANRRAAWHPLRHVQRRRHARSRHRLEPHRSPGAHARRMVDDRIVSERAARDAVRRPTDAAGYTARVDLDRHSSPASGFSIACSSRISPTRAISVLRPRAAFCRRRGRRATSRSPGPPTPSARAGASTSSGAACACTRRCAARGPTSSFIPATRFTPTRRSRRKSGCRMARCGETSPRRAKSKVAETLDEFRGNYTYNLLDEQRAPLQREIPQLVAVGRPRGEEQLVSGHEPGRRRSLHQKRLARARGERAARVSRIRADSSGAGAMCRRSTARVPTARCSRCSRSTCAPTAARTRRTGRRPRARRQRTPARSSSPG